MKTEDLALRLLAGEDFPADDTPDAAYLRTHASEILKMLSRCDDSDYVVIAADRRHGAIYVLNRTQNSSEVVFV